jgi:hypothetical protein
VSSTNRPEVRPAAVFIEYATVPELLAELSKRCARHGGLVLVAGLRGVPNSQAHTTVLFKDGPNEVVKEILKDLVGFAEDGDKE